MKRILTVPVFVILLALMLAFSASVSAKEECHWYCKRNADHKQPALDTNMQFIEDFGGYYIDKDHGDECDEKVIYLTFDVGYENGNVSKILDALKAEEVKGAFFVLGNVIKREPELIERMTAEGHLVCNHTTNHKNLAGADKESIEQEVRALEDMYCELTGKDMSKFFRFPEGTFDKSSIKQICSMGYKTVFWSFAYADWDNSRQMSEDAALEKILTNLHNGEIMLLHPTSATNAKIMPRLIKELKALGYRFGSLDEL